MNDYQSVNKASLYYRLMPRLLISAFMTVLIILVISFGLGYFHLDKYLPYTILLGLLIFAILGLITLVTAYLEYSNLKYLIEEHALFLKEGVFEVDTETIPFQKIRNACFYQNILQRLYKVGDLVIDQDPETYTWVGIDTKTAGIILDSVSARSNIQPISVEASGSNPYQKPPTPTQSPGNSN
jgi:membrane protein YdbS with pleckstrin-like domain